MAAGSDTITPTVVVSAITSGIVSLAAFVVGVRMTKDQGDRAIMRQIYRRLYEHFRDLDAAIAQGAPMRWADFPHRGNEAMPPVKAMKKDGEASLLPDDLHRECDDLERQTLVAGSKYQQWIAKNYIPQLRDLVLATTGATSSITGRSYRPLSATELPLMQRAEVRALADDLEQCGTGLGLELAVEPGRTNMLHLYADRLERKTLGGILEEGWNIARQDQEGGELIRALEGLRPRLAQCRDRLVARIRDPHPLRESLARAFRDVTARG